VIQLDGEGTKYAQLARGFRDAILRNEFPPGVRIPGTRALAKDMRLSRNVVLAAYEQLLAEGYLESRPKSGTFVAQALANRLLEVCPKVASDARIRSDQPRLSRSGSRAVTEAGQARALSLFEQRLPIDFEYGIARPDAETICELGRLHGRVIRQAVYDYGDTMGDPALRAELAKHLRRHRGVAIDAEQVIVTSGSQQGLDLCARILLDPGDRVVVEQPLYQGARHVFNAAAAQLVPIAVDDQGMQVAALSDVAKGARMAYVTPSHQFPTGAVMPLSRRLALLAWARREQAYLIEDDYDSEFRYDCGPLQAIAGLASGAPVIYVGTFAKSLTPSLRLGLLALPKSLVGPFRDMKWLIDRGNPGVYQRVIAAFMANGGYERHLRRMNRRYAERRACLVQALHSELGAEVEVAGANAGTHLVVWLNRLSGSAVSELISGCRQRGVGVYSLAPYYASERPRPGLLLGFSALDPEQIQQGVAILAQIYRGLQASNAAGLYTPVGLSCASGGSDGVPDSVV